MSPEKYANGAKSALWLTFSLAVMLNLAEALWHPPGNAWLAVRVTVSVLFTAVLIACIGLWMVRHRQRGTRTK